MRNTVTRMKQSTIDKGLYRIHLGIAAIVIGILLNVAAVLIYYLGPTKEVYPEITSFTIELFGVGTALLGLGVYKHVRTSRDNARYRNQPAPPPEADTNAEGSQVLPKEGP